MKKLTVLLAAALVLTGCANPAIRQADELSRANQLPQAYQVLDAAAQIDPADPALRAAQLRTRELLSNRLIVQIEGLRGAGRWAQAQEAVQRLRDTNPKHPRLAVFEAEIERGQRQESKLLTGRALLREGKLDRAEALAREIIAESPQQPGARLLLSQIAQARPLEATAGVEMGPAFQKPVTLEFREAPLRQVFEALARSSNVNFVFDKDVRSDAKVTVFLRNVSLDEALRVILSTQQLDRKLLNEASVLIFPNTTAKQREHQELITRTLYLSNADVKQVQAMVRTIAKVRDIHIDERLNLMIVRDTPEVMKLVEKLIASIDLPDPEVMLEVEVLELASDKVDALGLQWPEQIQYGLLNSAGQLLSGQVPLNQVDQFRGSIANPGLVATLRGTSGNANLLANPKIRVRNRDKAKVQIGQKLPVFTTTSNLGVGQNAAVASSVSYLDVGLKLEVEPTVQLDNDVIIKLSLEVSNLLRQVAGPGGSTAYEIGTRQASTSLRLNDGETQILAGLINDEDRRSAAGLPGLSSLPILGRLFGVQTDTRNKTEVVLLITPRIVRNLALPDSALTRLASGTDAAPGAFSNLLRSSAKAGVGLSGALAPPAPITPTAAAPAEAVVRFDVTPQVPAGGTVSISLKNESGLTVKGSIDYDPSKLAPGQPMAGVSPGSYPIEMSPRGDKVVVLRALPAANGQVLNISISGLTASGLNGETASVRLDGTGLLTVDAPR
jgi:general secretion pathway protein D